MQIISGGSGTGSFWEKQNCNFGYRLFFVVYLKRKKMLNCINVKN